MADDEKTTIVATGDDAAASAAGGKKKLFLFGGIGAVVVVVVAALFLLGPMSGSDSGEGDSHAAVAKESHSSHGDSHSSGSTAGHGGHGGEAGAIYTIDGIIVNPAGTGGSRFLSASVGFQLGSSQLEGAFEQKDAVIRDALITILSSKTVAQLTDVKQKEITRYQIKKRVEKLMGVEEIAGVYFTDFVLQ